MNSTSQHTASAQQIEGTPLWMTEHNAGFWQITIDSPPLNLFGPEFLTGMEEVVRRMQSVSELRVVVFDSAIPDYFIAHFDTARGAEVLNRKTTSGLSPWYDVVQALYALPVLSIAKIRGRARGVGIEFAAACDLRFASEKAIFGQIEVGVGTIPGGGSMEHLPFLTGRARALEIIIGAEDLDASVAERYGLINRMIPDDKLDDFVYKLALRISRFDAVITGKAKSMINERSPMPSMDFMNASRSEFIHANQRPERKAINENLRNWGIGQDNDFEKNLGDWLNKI